MSLPAISQSILDRYYIALTESREKQLPFVTVPVELFDIATCPDIAIYLKPTEPQGEPKLFRQKGLYISQFEIQNLQNNGHTELLIQWADAPLMTTYVESIVQQTPTESELADPKKIELLQTSAIGVINDIFTNPSPENIKRGVKTVSSFVYVLMKDPKAYGMLLGLSNHDHYTLQHSVGVATNSIILAHKIGIKDEKTLIEVGLSGLLHDIGKTKVNPAIINKKGPLDEKEWAEMKEHARWGFELIKNNPDVGTRAKLGILQHHEEPAGGGYPLGLKNEQIDLFAKIVTISDIYNALTTDRTYSSAKPPFEAFQIMKSKLSHKVDDALFESLVLVYGGKLL